MFKYRFPIYCILIEMHGNENHYYEEKHMEHHGYRCEPRNEECRHGRMGMDGPMRQGNMRFRGLRPIVLDLLSDDPKKGSEIMSAMEEKTEGRWRPSPGSIYPMLAGMEAEGLIQKNPDGRYSLSEDGKKEIELHKRTMMAFGRRRMPETPEEIIFQVNSYLDYFSDIVDELTGQEKDLKALMDRLDGLISKISSKPGNTKSQ